MAATFDRGSQRAALRPSRAAGGHAKAPAQTREAGVSGAAGGATHAFGSLAVHAPGRVATASPDSGAAQSGPGRVLRRQPGQTQQAPPNPLQGHTTRETVTSSRESLADAALQQSDLWPYIGGKVIRGTRVKGSVTFLDDKSFVAAYTALTNNAGDEDLNTLQGYYDRRKDHITLRKSANLGRLLHESIHKFASPSFNGIFAGLDEGVTQFFTNHVLEQFGLDKGKEYPERVPAAAALARMVGFETLALDYFIGPANHVADIVARTLGGDAYNQLLHLLRVKHVDWPAITQLLSPAQHIHQEFR